MKKVLKIKKTHKKKRGNLNRAYWIFEIKAKISNSLPLTRHIISTISTPFTCDLGSCTSNLNISPPIGYPSCHLWRIFWFIWSWRISQWLVTRVLCCQVSILRRVMCSREFKPVSTVPQIFLTNHVGLPCVSIQCWISQLSKLYQPIDLIFVSVYVGSLIPSF